MSHREVLERPLTELRGRRYADAILQSLDSLKYPGLSADEEYFVYLIIVESYIRLCDYELAGQNIKAISDLPASPKLREQYYLLRAELDVREGRYADGIQHLNDFEFESSQIERIGTNRMAICKYLKGIAYLRQGFRDLALEQLHGAIPLFQDRLGALTCRAQLAVVEDDLSQLQDTATHLLEEFPAYPGLIELCADMSILLENDGRAVIFAEKCNEFAGVFGRSSETDLLARTYARFGQFNKAASAIGEGQSSLKADLLLCEGKFGEVLDGCGASAPAELRAIANAALGNRNETLSLIDGLLASKEQQQRLAAAACFALLGEPAKAIKIVQNCENSGFRMEKALIYASASFAQENFVDAYMAALVGEDECAQRYGRGFGWAEIISFALEALVKTYEIVQVPVLLQRAEIHARDLAELASKLCSDGLSQYAEKMLQWAHE